MAPSCNFRFEIYPFYEPLPDAPSPSPTNFPPSFPPPTNATTGNGMHLKLHALKILLAFRLRVA